MIFLLFNILLLLISSIILFDFKKGFLAVLCYRMAVPYMVRFDMGPISINGNDLLLLILFISFIIHGDIRKVPIPKEIRNLMLIYISTTLLLILFSYEIVPYSYQISSFARKFLLQEQLFFFLGFFALRNSSIKGVTTTILIIAILCGIYGIFTYIIKANPYVDGVSIAYTGKIDRFSDFIFEERGLLSGRICGTKTHPLEWGQLWVIIISFCFLAKNYIHKIWLFVIAAIGLVNILLCGSRSSLLALAVIAVFFVLIVGFNKRYLLYTLFAMIIGVSYLYHSKTQKITDNNIILASIMFWDDSYSNKLSIHGSSFGMRQIQLQESYKMISNNPLCGVGYDYEYYNKRNNTHELWGMESILFKKLVEQGFLGLFIFFLVYFTYYHFLKNLFVKSEELKLFLGYTLSYLVSIIATGIQGGTWVFYILLQYIIATNRNTKVHLSKSSKICKRKS